MEDALLQLSEGLHCLLVIAEKGEWEKMDEQLASLLPLMETVRATAFHRPPNALGREQIELVIDLLQTASNTCSTRKEQITPLINAFAKATEAPTKP